LADQFLSHLSKPRMEHSAKKTKSVCIGYYYFTGKIYLNQRIPLLQTLGKGEEKPMCCLVFALCAIRYALCVY
jgi:hypothetical protein